MPDLEPITREEMLLDAQDLEPITRKEMFIKRIYDKSQVIPEPITREEMFLKKAGEGGGSDVTIKQLSVTENGTYSEENTAYSPVIVNVPAPPIPDNAYLLNEVEGLPKDIATFNDGSNLPMPSLKVGIEPIQDLHGYDYPWVGGAGKNKLPLTVDGIKSANSGATWSGNSTTINNVTFTIQTDSDGNVKGINVNGTASGDSPSLYLCKNVTLSNDTYTLNGCPTNGSLQSYELFVDYSSGGNIPDYGSGASLPINNVTISARIRVQNGYNAQNLVFKPMIRLSSVTDATFAPYSNECPISGWSAVDVTIQDDIDNPTTTETITIQLGDTYYGAKLDVVSGVLTVDREYVDMGTLNWIYESDATRFRAPLTDVNTDSRKLISSIYHYSQNPIGAHNQDLCMCPYAYGGVPSIFCTNFSYTDSPTFKTAMNGVQLVYELATPLTIQLTPTQVKSLLGQNNIWADTGDIKDAEYFSKEV